MSTESLPAVVCFGEILWDALPRGIFLGGAPLNVAAHLSTLGQSSRLISAVGNDFLGSEAVERVSAHGVDASLVEHRQREETGVVKARLSANGDAKYDILANKAWDKIIYSAAMKEAVVSASAFVYGTLSARSTTSRETLERLLQIDGPLRFFDVNLRPPHWEREVFARLLSPADLIKLNRDELIELSGSDSRVEVPDLVQRFSQEAGKKRICVTDGANGAWFFDGEAVHHASAQDVTVRDTVGAGDAFAARLLLGLLRGEAIPDALASATKRGSWVASQDGAVPANDGNPFHPIDA